MSVYLGAAGLQEKQCSLQKNSQAVSTDILHSRARVLGVCGQGLFMGSL